MGSVYSLSSTDKKALRGPRLMWLPFAFLVTTFAGLSLPGCAKTPEYTPPPPPSVTVARPLEQEIQDSLEYTGSIESIETVEIRARVQGFLESFHFTEGDDVTEGNLLFVIDPKPFQAAVNGAKAALALAEANRKSADATLYQARAQYANADAQYKRAERAAQSGAVTQAELDNLQTLRTTAAAEIRVAEANITSSDADIQVKQADLQQAELDYSYTQVTAPLTGRVGKRDVDIGNLVGSGEPTLLTTIVKYDPVYAYFTISEADFLRLLRRHAPQDQEDAQRRAINIGLAGEEGYPHKGHFDYADLKIDRSTGTYEIRAIVDNTDQLLPPGAFARVEVPTRVRQALLTADVAVARDQVGPYVIVVNEQNVAERRNVVLGRNYGILRLIEQGLEPGDHVVINGVQRARPGVEVTPEEQTLPSLEGELNPQEETAAESQDEA